MQSTLRRPRKAHRASPRIGGSTAGLDRATSTGSIGRSAPDEPIARGKPDPRRALHSTTDIRELAVA
jgi:hypothetical protein